MLHPETRLQIQIANYLAQNYPDVIFHSDVGSGVKLPPHIAKIQAAQNGGRRGYPDMFIAKPRVLVEKVDGTARVVQIAAGLYIELKAEGVRVFKRNGEVVADEHIREQARVLRRLREQGYAAEFGIGYDATIKIIDEYLGGKDEWRHHSDLSDVDSDDDSSPF